MSLSPASLQIPCNTSITDHRVAAELLQIVLCTEQQRQKSFLPVTWVEATPLLQRDFVSDLSWEDQSGGSQPFYCTVRLQPSPAPANLCSLLWCRLQQAASTLTRSFMHTRTHSALKPVSLLMFQIRWRLLFPPAFAAQFSLWVSTAAAAAATGLGNFFATSSLAI